MTVLLEGERLALYGKLVSFKLETKNDQWVVPCPEQKR